MELFFYSLAMGAFGVASIMAALGIFCFLYSAKGRWDVVATAVTAYVIHLALLPLAQ